MEHCIDAEDPDYKPSPIKRGVGRPKKSSGDKIDDHSFEELIDKMVDKRRGLRKSVFGEPQYSSTEMMKEYKKRYSHVFLIQIAPPDFPKEQFFDFVFPKPLESMEIIANESSEGYVSLVNNIHSGLELKCLVCLLDFENNTQLKDHYAESHTIYYKCPKDDCDFTIHKTEDRLSEYKLARHIYYHNGQQHPQYSNLHECIACGYKTPYIGTVDSHCKTMGPYHINKCPRCDLKFKTRADLLDHVNQANHGGYVCGFCGEVFDAYGLKREHDNSVHGKNWLLKQEKAEKQKPKMTDFVCHQCGAVCPNKSILNLHIDKQHKPPGIHPCDICGKVFDLASSLHSHTYKFHKKNPCNYCGKMFNAQRLKEHIGSIHTEDHLKPFRCAECNKGFGSAMRLKQHMIIHSGLKPHVCKYCGRGFADLGNMRMHERTSHEGHKRNFSKRKKN